MTEERRFNVLNHVMVPLHELVPEPEVNQLLKRMGIQKEHLPRIRTVDPAAQVVGAKPGNVVKITRRSPTAGQAVAYRLVVEAI